MTDAAFEAGAPAFRPGTSDAEIEDAARRAADHRRNVVMAWRVGILVVFLGAWELAGRTGWIDPFFYAMPSMIAGRLYD